MHALIIGFGHAGQAYLAACRAFGGFDRITVVDLDPAVAASLPEGVVFADEVPAERTDLAIVATPPHTHLQVLDTVADRARRVVLEKPFALNARDIDAIFALAERAEVFFSIHACYGAEIALAQDALARMPLAPNAPVAVSQLYCDPYWPDGPKNLGGPFWDSIFNALGVMNTLWRDLVWTGVDVRTDRADLFDVACTGHAAQGPMTYRLTVDWGRALNLKVTEVADGARREGLLINHSQQCLSALSGLGLVAQPFEIGRLASHYQAALAACLATSDLRANTRLARRVADQVLQIAAERPDGARAAS